MVKPKFSENSLKSSTVEKERHLDHFWEGNFNKMEQGFKLCLLDYDFFILDTPFLIHKPGIKTPLDRKNEKPKSKIQAQLILLTKTIIPKIEKEYGKRKGCKLH